MIDLAASSTAFAPVVGLLSEFVGQRRANANQTYEEFMSWLAENRHDEIISLISQNLTTTTSIKALLAQDRDALQARLERIDRSLAIMASVFDGFGDLAEAVRPGTRLSGDAVAFLQRFDRSGASRVLEVITMDGRHLLPFDGNTREEIIHGSPRFFDDDIAIMIEADLLRPSINSRGQRIFAITRRASELVQLMASPSAAALKGVDRQQGGH